MSNRLNALRSAPATVIAVAIDQLPAEAVQPASASVQDRVDFALDWARWEPAFVAQQHREWSY
ncbi:MAG: hypothetical protein ABI224_17125 [Acetobacteraceae bacterium]